jgi:hypothetical protein
MKSSLRQVFTLQDIDAVAVVLAALVISCMSLFPLHEWAMLASLFIAGAVKASRFQELAQRKGYLIPWTKMSLLIIALSAFVCARASDFSDDYWLNYIAALCFGIWGYAVGVGVGFLEYFWLRRKVAPGSTENMALVA